MSGENMKAVKGFYFAAKARILRYGDRREIVVGETHSVDGPVKLCERGLHASKRLIDALFYAPGPILYRVELSGDIRHGSDKMVATHRRYLAEFDAEDLLWRFTSELIAPYLEKIATFCSEEFCGMFMRYLTTGDKSDRDMAYDVLEALSPAEYDVDIGRYRIRRALCWMLTVYGVTRVAREAVRLDGIEKGHRLLSKMVREATGWEI